MTLENDIRSFFETEFNLKFQDDLDDQTNLFDGHIDSFSFLKIIDWVENFSKSHGVKIYPEDLFAEGTLSVQSMANYLKSKLVAS